jgi:hypothetical protein
MGGDAPPGGTVSSRWTSCLLGTRCKIRRLTNAWSGRESWSGKPCAPDLLCAHGARSKSADGRSSSSLEPVRKDLVNPFLIALPLVITCLLIGYLVRERSLRGLDTLQAGTLVLAIRPHRIRFATITACLLAAFLILRYTLPRFGNIYFICSLVLLLVAIAISQHAGRQALSRAQMPRAFMRLYVLAQFFDFAGYASLLGAMMATLWFHGHA